MDSAMEITEDHGLAAFADAQMYGVMRQKLSVLVRRILEIFPALEAVQPRRSGMQALCGLHWALDKAKTFLQQIAHSSKLYLIITSDSVVVKFEKVKDSLEQSLRRLESNLPEDLAQQVSLIVADLQEVSFEPDPSDHDAGNDIINLLQKEKEDPGFTAPIEIDVFNQVASKVGITSYKAVLTEKKALRRLLDKARSEEDRKKELVVQYLLHLLRKYIKVQKFPNTDDGCASEMMGSCPASPSERGSEASTSGRDSSFSSDLCYFQLHQKRVGNGSSSCLSHALIPPEEFRCPISLQLMSDPVIISSGQTYERVCIQKWFEEGHDTCPKTQQKLTHLDVTPNYCVKGLITSWCERHSVPIPTPPSPPPPVTNWLSEAVSAKSNTQSEVMISSEHHAGLKKDNGYGTMEKCRSISLPLVASVKITSVDSCCSMKDRCRRGLLDNRRALQMSTELLLSTSLEVQQRAAEEIRLLTKDNTEARSFIGELGTISALVGFLSTSIDAGVESAQKAACLALLNAAINNNRNKAEIVQAGGIPLLVILLGSGTSLVVKEAAIVVLLTASCLDENKPGIGSSGAVAFLVDHLDTGSHQGVKDALTTLFNLSIYPGNHHCVVKAGAIPKLIHFLSLGDVDLKEKCAAILYNLSSIDEGRAAIAEAEGSIGTLAEVLDSGTQKEKELVAGIFFLLCTNSSEHSQLVLREGVVPSLVMLSVNGTARGKDKAQKLLQHFREERQKEAVWHSTVPAPSEPSHEKETQRDKTAEKCFPRRINRSGSSFAFFRKSKSFSFYRC